MRLLSKPVLVVAVVALVATAGCLSGPFGAGTGTTAETTTDDAPPGSTDASETESTTFDGDVSVHRASSSNAPNIGSELLEPTDCGDHGWVSWWGTGDTATLWSQPGELRMGYTVPANQSTLFVAFENASVVGADHEEYDAPVTADGAGITVNATTGEHRYAVVMMHDVDGNGEYDPGTDRPCKSDDGGIVITDWLWVDWGGDD